MDEKNQDLIDYTFKGKIMISAAVILFAACFAIILFHVYTRWCRHRRRRSRHIPIVISPPAWPYAATPQGLDLHAVNALPTFVYSSENQEPPPECAVCLSEFDGGENGRILPDCNHYFHVDCIDMWLESHRDCPLCRTRVKSLPDPDRHEFTVVSIFLLDEPDPMTGCESGSDPNGGSDEIQPCFPSSSSPEKAEGAPNPTLKIRIQDTG